jgi:xylono-1,5-lactonase
MPIADIWIKGEHPLAESIIWHVASRCIMWVDLLEPAIFIHDPRNGKTRREALPFQAPIGSMAATTDRDRVIIAHRGGLSLLHLETFELEFYCDPEQGRDAIIYNDIKVDRWGRLWVGTSHAREQEPRGALWCVKDRKTFALADAGFAISNGPAFSPDGSKMYFNDSLGRKTYAYDIAPDDMRACNRRVVREYAEGEGLPDGLGVDAHGNLWSAQWGGAAVLHMTPDGAPLQRIDVPAYNVTTLCWGGDDLTEMLITTARDGVSAEHLKQYPLTGSLFRARAEVPGLAEPLFAI